VTLSIAQNKPGRWIQFSLRGEEYKSRELSRLRHFNPIEPNREEIEKSDQKEDFNPNVFSTRQEALERFEALKKLIKTQT